MDEPIVDPEFDLVRSRGSDVHVVPTPAGEFKDQVEMPVICLLTFLLVRFCSLFGVKFGLIVDC